MQVSNHWLKLFYARIDEQGWFTHHDRLLLAVSGGLDSMVLCDLIRRRYPKMAVAHCNFGLRGSESDEDEQFVKSYCRQHGITCFVKHLDASSLAASEGISIQMAARKLRYEWFYSLCGADGFDRILTAHHADDQTETFFIQLFRKAGLKALGGMEAFRDRLVRPLLHLPKSVLLEYAQNMNLQWREDSSNRSDKYLRNSIRLHLLPALRNVRPEIDEAVHQNMAYLREASEALDTLIHQEILPAVIGRESGFERLDFSKTPYVINHPVLFYYLMQTRGFNRSQSDQMLQSLMEQRSGKRFQSPDWEAITDRGNVWLLPGNHPRPQAMQITQAGTYVWGSFRINITLKEASTTAHDPNTAVFDADKVQFPLMLSSPENGMVMYPRGFGHKRLLSDILAESRIPAAIKPFTPVICDATGRVLWAYRQRPDHHSAPNTGCHTILRISCEVLGDIGGVEE